MTHLKSLSWRLVWSLILLQVVVSAVVLGGYVFWLKDRLVDENGEQAAATIGKAIVRAEDGRLSLGKTGEAARLLSASPSFWFIARDSRGMELRHGEVPTRYASLVGSLDGLERSAIDLATENAQPRARFERFQTNAGAVNLVVQTGTPLSLAETLHGTGLIALFVVAPMALVTAIGVIFAIPFVVKRALKGLRATADRAAHIDVDQRTVLLPLDFVATEIRPMMNAVNEAFERLNRGYARQERFLADAAHELRTPITILQLQIEGLPENSIKVGLMRASARLATLAEQLLDLQRLKQIGASEQPVDLKALCERVTAEVAPLAIRSRCRLAVNAPCQLTIRGDAVSIERALSNLIQNAIEHGGADCEIDVNLLEPACIEVCDTGPGIPETERERVVEPFYRLVPRDHGAGLGLNLVAEVARLHGGKLTIGASASGGARMRLELADTAPQRSRNPHP